MNDSLCKFEGAIWRPLIGVLLSLLIFLAEAVHAQTIGDAVDNTTLTWTTGGNANWLGQSATSFYGGSAAQSGDIANSQTSYIETTVTGHGTLSFYWKVSSEDTFDKLRFILDGVEQNAISGELDWAERTYTISASGTHTLRWEYVKDEADSVGQDAGWLDKVIWIPAVSTYTLTVNSTAAINVEIASDPSTYGGTTNYTKTGIPEGTTITLNAPMMSGGLDFGSWSGCDSSTGMACTVTMNTAKTVTANYSYFFDNGDGTVTDTRTGLNWMRCALGQTWSPEGNTCKGTAAAYTWDEATALTHSFAGQSDWRLPNIRELTSIVDYNRCGPAIDLDAFPGTPNSYFWSGSAQDIYFASSVDFGSGNSSSNGRSYDTNHVRLVRDGQSFALLNDARPSTDYRDNGDGTVVHLPTGLTWLRCAIGQTWTGTTCDGTANTFTWDEATTLTHKYAGQDDWRLPNILELTTLVDYKKRDPAINIDLFPYTPGEYFWSKSPYVCGSDYALGVQFYNSFTRYVYGGNASRVRLVRGGQQLAHFALSVGKQGAGTVTSSQAGIDCGSTCSAYFMNSTTVDLVAVPAAGNYFLGWSGACAGNGPACGVSMHAEKSVTATFAPLSVPSSPTITRITPGNGSMRIDFTPPTNTGGTTIASYTASCMPTSAGSSPPPVTGTNSPITVTGLTTGISYTCTVSATNSTGTSAASAGVTKVVKPNSIAPILPIILD